MKKWLKIMLVMMLMFVPMQSVSAEETKTQSPTFTIEPVFPKNQVVTDAGYFHLDIRDMKNQVIELLVHNNDKETHTFGVYFNVAKTNQNGVIVYEEKQAQKPNHTLPYNIENQVELSSKQLTIPANTSEKLQMKLNYEGLEYPGILMGAVSVREQNGSDHVGIDHQYQYTVGIVLSQDGRKDLPSSKTFEMNDVAMNVDAGHKVLDYYIDNLENNIARNLNFASALTNLDTQKLVFDEKVENYSIAPNGRLPMKLDWQRKDVEPGNYRLEVNLNEGKETWTHDFVIEPDEAKELNKTATYRVRIPSWTFMVCIILGILTIVNTVYLIQRQNKREE